MCVPERVTHDEESYVGGVGAREDGIARRLDHLSVGDDDGSAIVCFLLLDGGSLLAMLMLD